MNTILIVAALAVLLMLLERLRPAVVLPTRRGWYARVALLNGAQIAAVLVGAHTWERWFSGYSLLSAAQWHPVLAVISGYLLITFVYYWWHRARHEVPLLWRYLHQVHHSCARVEVMMSFYKHPLEIVINGLLSSALLNLVLGLNATSAAIVVAITGIAELLYHSNLRTPYWIGYFFQRPESHRVHHQRGWHRQNFSDLPLWDMLFGTFHNPREPVAECGFTPARERDLVGLMLGLTKPRAAAVRSAPREVLVGVLLAAVGCSQMLAELGHAPRLRAVAAATQLAPLMRVFTAHQGVETFAARFALGYLGASGEWQEVAIDHRNYAVLDGPYNRRNVYGAAFSYAPLLAQNPATAKMWRQVVHYALCEPGSLRAALGLPAARQWRLRLDPIVTLPAVSSPQFFLHRCEHG